MRQIKFLAVLALMSSWVLFPAMNARGQVAPPQFSWICFAGANNQPNVYISGVMQGPATAGQSFQTGFAQDLAQKYMYPGAVACRPSQNATIAQNSLNSFRFAWRNAKKNVIDTGWTEAAPAAPGTAGTAATAGGPAGTPAAATNILGGLLKTQAPSTTPTAPAAGGAQTSNKQPQGGGNPSGANAPQGGGGASTGTAKATNVLGILFGTPAAGGGSGSGSATGGAKASQGQAVGKTAGGSGGTGGGGGGGASTGAVTQVASTLSNLFGKGTGGPAAGGAGSSAKSGAPAENGAGGGSAGAKGAGAAPVAASTPNANAPSGLPQGALGSAQYQNTMLVVYGCGRQGTDGTQILCVTDLTNQNAKDTMVQSANVWKDAFIVDDRGDRHTRSSGYFLNIDEEQRQQLDIDNGKSAHFILAFDGVPAKVEKITLRSATGGLDVNGISLIAVTAADASMSQAP